MGPRTREKKNYNLVHFALNFVLGLLFKFMGSIFLVLYLIVDFFFLLTFGVGGFSFF